LEENYPSRNQDSLSFLPHSRCFWLFPLIFCKTRTIPQLYFSALFSLVIQDRGGKYDGKACGSREGEGDHILTIATGRRDST